MGNPSKATCDLGERPVAANRVDRGRHLCGDDQIELAATVGVPHVAGAVALGEWLQGALQELRLVFRDLSREIGRREDGSLQGDRLLGGRFPGEHGSRCEKDEEKRQQRPAEGLHRCYSS